MLQAISSFLWDDFIEYILYKIGHRVENIKYCCIIIISMRLILWPTRAIQKYKPQYNNIYFSTTICIPVQKNTFKYTNMFFSTTIYIPEQILFWYRITEIYVPVQKYMFQYRNIFPTKGRGSIISQTSLWSYACLVMAAFEFCGKYSCMLLKLYLFFFQSVEIKFRKLELLVVLLVERRHTGGCKEKTCSIQ